MLGTTNPKNDLYALTITFKNLPHNISAKAQFKGTYKTVCKTLEESTDYEMFPEWRTTNNTIHYHGTIYIKDKIKWHKSTYSKLSKMGFIKIKKVDELQGWLEYCQKESAVAKEILKPVLIPLKNGCIKHTKEQVNIIEDKIIKICTCECIECKLNPILQKNNEALV